MTRQILGFIDCPTCGHPKGMRITKDKNGEPFGFSEACCNQQMRVGGDARRVAAFVARYPWAAGANVQADAPVTAPAPAQAAKPAPAQASVGPFDFLMRNQS